MKNLRLLRSNDAMTFPAAVAFGDPRHARQYLL
jgi:hypothetical protein